MKANIKYIAHLLTKMGDVVDMSQYLRGLDELVKLSNQDELDLSNYTMVGYNRRDEIVVLYDGDSSEIWVYKDSVSYPGNYGIWGDVTWIDM